MSYRSIEFILDTYGSYRLHKKWITLEHVVDTEVADVRLQRIYDCAGIPLVQAGATNLSQIIYRVFCLNGHSLNMNCHHKLLNRSYIHVTHNVSLFLPQVNSFF